MTLDRTMVAALRGSLAHHPWIGSADAFSLFVSRSSAMGWLSSHVPGGLWGMNDAGSDPSGAWFQVSVTAETVPVQAFLACAGDVVTRLGEFRLESVELTVPLGTDSMMGLLQDAGWFADRDPRLVTSVRVAVDPFVPEIVGWMREFKQDVASFSSFDEGEVVLAEWSPAALGWMAAFLAEASARHGVGTPLRITASRA